MKDTQLWWNQRRADVSKVVDESEAEDWNFLWDNVPSRLRKKCESLLKTNNCGGARKN